MTPLWQTTLLSSGLIGLATAALYGYVGARISRRELSGDARGANRAFVLWWGALGALTGISALLALAAAAGMRDLRIHVGLTVLLYFVLFAALWGLSYYLAYLFTGRAWTGPVLGLFYGVYLLWVLWLMWRAHPAGVEVGMWSTSLRYESELAPGGTSQLLLLVLLLPPILGALAYASLYVKVDDPSQRYRIAVVSLTILVWFGSSIVASLAGLNDLTYWPLVSRAIGLVAALVILSGFAPPGWLRQRFGVQPVS